MSFTKLGLSDALVRAVADAGYSQPTAIQSQAIPLVLSGCDLLAGAQTGTGKTAAFVLPILQRLASQRAGTRAPAKVRGLILAPTRELAAQVEESVRTYGKHSGISSGAVFGGVSINPQIAQLRMGVDVLVATPGRLLDHCGQRTLDLSAVEILVLDEADRMLDMRFLPDIKRILAILPKRRQNLLFSATFSDPIRALADSLLNAPKHIQVAPRNSTVESIVQTVHPVDAGRKAELLVHLIGQGSWYQVLVFTRTKHAANKLAQYLQKNRVPALAIHGNKSQNARTRALSEFKNGKLQVLVATDIAARGLDIEELPHVVNFELPHVPEDYVHRIGRTGRAGAGGEAVSLVSSEEHARLRDIERLVKRSIARVVVGGFEPGRHGSQPGQPVGDHKGRGQPLRSQHPSPSGPSEAAQVAPHVRGKVIGHRVAGRSMAARPGAARFARNASRSDATSLAGRGTEPDSHPRTTRGSSSLVRSNLPPGWTAATPPRRSR